jgi:glucose-6-phosphate 1-dehydrogenase
MLLGEANLFPRQREVELAWQILDPIEAHWSGLGRSARYQPGTWGPGEADRILGSDGRTWRRP